MSLYSISLFLHIVGALAIFAAFGLEWAGLHNLRRASTVEQVREWVRLLGAPRFVGGPAALTLLVTGIHMSATRWGGQGWIVVGFGGMVVMAVTGVVLSGRRVGAIARALPAEEGPISTTLARLLRDPVLALSLGIRAGLLLGVVFVMSTKPSVAGALTALGVALALGLAASQPARKGDRRPARMEPEPM